MDKNLEKPELIQTSLGFSVLYKGKALYSKRNPSKSILALINNTIILPKTLVFCISPLLGYGLRELLTKLPDNSIAIGIEHDTTLLNFSKQHVEKKILQNEQFKYIQITAKKEFLKEINLKIEKKGFKHIVKIDFSGGANLHRTLYQQLTESSSQLISRYWINRLTLIQFGRNYSRNLFKNFLNITKQPKINFTFLKPKSIEKPILVIGAGPSVDENFKFILRNREKFFIIAVDAISGIYPKIKPDTIIILESQFWIQRAFLGLENSDIPLILDLTTNPKITSCTLGKVAFFYTNYQSNVFFDKLETQNLLPIKLEPMGSVGLSALKIAEILATNETPIFHTGLDFAWGKGFSHSKLSFQIKEKFSSLSKFNNLYSSFKTESALYKKIIGKNNTEVFTSPNLQSYAELYKNFFSNKNNFYDIGKSGIIINSNLINLEHAEKIITNFYKINNHKLKANPFQDSYLLKNRDITKFLQTEKNKLNKLKNMLIGSEIYEELIAKKIIISSPYLYLHFPDYSIDPILEKNFLTRIRIEIEYFLKILK